MTTYDVTLPDIPEDVTHLKTTTFNKYTQIWKKTGNDSWFNEQADLEVSLRHILCHFGPVTVVEKQYEIWYSAETQYSPPPFKGTREECNKELQRIVVSRINYQFRLIEFQYLDGWVKFVNPYDLDMEPREYRIQAIDTDDARS